MYKTTWESTANVETRDIGQAVEDMKMTAKSRRRIFERRWYDNNFFDDGFHFRYLSRSSNKIVDLSERATIYTPQRAIPKSSRQIRGISNLLMANDPTPTIYPDPVDKKKYENSPPGTFEMVSEEVKRIAQYRGKWLLNEWKKDDGTGESILDKVALMTLLTMKHGVSFMQVWPDEYDEEIKTQVYDAFDIYCLGDRTNIYELPFICKSIPMLISGIRSNPIFDEEQLSKLDPDNKKASSEIKEAYLQSRYGRDTTADQSATIILNECFIREYVNKENRERIEQQEDGAEILDKIKENEPIIRQVFTAGGVWLKDHYTNLKEYPFVDYRMEAGPIYQVPMIERFMPANKSLDSVVSRLERYTHTMVTGAWMKRRGEQFKINNIAGGQVIEYDAVAPTQAQIAPVPPFLFDFINLITGFIEEQGVSTNSLKTIQSGVKADAAIEALKESEYANLVIPTRRLNATMRKLAVKCLEIADEHYVTPKRVSLKDKGEVLHFQVIGESTRKKRKKMNIDTPSDLISISKESIVDIEIEQGMAYTRRGQKGTMQDVMNTMIEMIKVQAIPPQALTSVVKKYLEVYQFGSTEDFMEDLDEAMKNGPDLSQQQLTTVKTALLEALKEAEEIGPKADQTKVQAAKVGTLEALHQSGLAKHVQAAGQAATAPTGPQTKPGDINYKDAPEDVKRQMEQAAGFQPSSMQSPVATDQALEHAKLAVEVQRSQLQPQGGQNAS